MSVSFSGTPWHEADRLFRSDPRWRGSDDAYSIDLGDERTLWLFGDSFIGSARREATFVRNSIALQTGSDPAKATIEFRWSDGPSSFFADRGDTWLWPLHGARLNGHLILFFMHVRSSRAPSLGPIEDWRADGPLGFFDVFDITTALAGIELALTEAGADIERGVAVTRALETYEHLPA